MPTNGDGCKAEGAAKGRPLASPDNAADTPLAGNPEGRGDSGRMAAFSPPDVASHTASGRALPCGQNRTVALVAIREMSFLHPWILTDQHSHQPENKRRAEDEGVGQVGQAGKELMHDGLLVKRSHHCRGEAQ